MVYRLLQGETWMADEVIYNGTKAEQFKKYYDLKNKHFQAIKKIYIPLVASLLKEDWRVLNILFIGVGYGRLEIPLIEAIIKVFKLFTEELLIKKEISLNIVAVDPAEGYINEFTENIKQLLNKEKKQYSIFQNPDNLKLNNKRDISIYIIKKDIRQAEEIFTTKYHIITAFFVFQLIDQWLSLMRKIIENTYEKGLFLTGEEKGFTRLIDGLYSDILKHEEFQDWINLWQIFHEERYKLGKPWFQTIKASDHEFLFDFLELNGWERVLDETLKFEGLEYLEYGEVIKWLEQPAPLFTPLSLRLTSEQRGILVEVLKEKKINNFNNNQKKSSERIEGIRFVCFQKKQDTSVDYTKAFERFLLRNSGLMAIDKETSLKSLFKSLSPPAYHSEFYEQDVIKRRLFYIGNLLFHTLCNKLHLEYVLWRPDFYDPRKGQYFHNLPSLIMFDDCEDKKFYIASYGLYFYAREVLKTTTTFIDLSFRQAPYFHTVNIRRGEKIGISLAFNQSSQTYALNVELPNQQNVEEGLKDYINKIKASLEENSNWKFGRNEIFYNFDDFLTIVKNYLPNNEPNQLREKINDLYIKFAEKYKCKIGTELLGIFQELGISENQLNIEDFVKSLFCFYLIGIGNSKIHWQLIKFAFGFVFERKKQMEGFSVLVGIDFSGYPEVGDVMQQVAPLWSSKDGMYCAMQIIHSNTHRHALRSAVAAIMSRNMSHNIGSHVLNYLSNPDYFENKEDFWLG